MPERLDYLRDRGRIYERSFAIIRAEADLSRFSAEEADVVVRMVHACGCVEVTSRIVFGDLHTTRSAAALDLWRDRLGGAVVAIGNAPTALFRLLEMIDAGAPRPAAIVGIPVGFVGAAEAKDALAADSRGVPFLTVLGRMGGSAMAAAAVNTLARAEI